MANAPASAPVLSAEELCALPRGGQRHELVEGVLQSMTPAGSRHGAVASTLHGRLYITVLDGALGQLFAAETGFLLRRDPDTVRAPDVAFISAVRLPDTLSAAFCEVVPDLVAEIVRPSDRAVDVTAKAWMWLDAGVRLVWVVDPSNTTVTVHRPGGTRTLRGQDVLDGEDVAPGFGLALPQLWS